MAITQRTAEKQNFLTRTLLRPDGTTRQAVLVNLIRDEDGVKVFDITTDKYGRFSINTSLMADGEYHLEYYGDGIIRTV